MNATVYAFCSAVLLLIDDHLISYYCLWHRLCDEVGTPMHY